MDRTPQPRPVAELDLAGFRARYGSPWPTFPAFPVARQHESSGSIARVAVTLGVIVAAVLTGHLVSGGPSVVPSPPAQAATPPLAPAAILTPDPAPGAPVHFPWLFTYADGLPARWPCGPIRYRLITDGAPAGARELLSEAVVRIAAESGLQFREDSPVVAAGTFPGIEVSWVPRAELKSPDPTTIGLGGASATGGHYTTGYVKIANDWSGSASMNFGPDGAGPVLLHELGHALGLSHTNDLKAVMYPSDQGNSDWTPAERAALRYLRKTC